MALLAAVICSGGGSDSKLEALRLLLQHSDLRGLKFNTSSSASVPRPSPSHL